MESLVDKIQVKCDCKLIYEIFKYRPHHISSICPLSIHSVSLNHGEWGTVGSIITWTYFLDLWVAFTLLLHPKITLSLSNDLIKFEEHKSEAKEIVEDIDDEKKLVKFKVIGGDLTKLYKTFSFTVQGESNGEEHFVKWTLTYEKLDESVPDPTTLMEFCLSVTKDIDAHHIFFKDL